MKAALARGFLPVPYNSEWKGVDPLPEDAPFKVRFARKAWLMGSCAGAVTEVQPAKQIVEEMVGQAAALLSNASKCVVNAQHARL